MKKFYSIKDEEREKDRVRQSREKDRVRQSREIERERERERERETEREDILVRNISLEGQSK